MGKRRTLLIATASVALAIVLSVPLAQDDQPRHKGRTLEQWAEVHDYNITAHQEATDAIIVMTTNSVPVLVRWLSWDPASPEVLANKLPTFVRYNRFLGPLIYQTNKLFRSNLAMKAFIVSETNAICAIPALTQVITKHRSWPATEHALYALAYIGPQALPSIRQGINNPDPRVRYAALSCIAGNTNAAAALPDAVTALSDPDASVREMATNFIRVLAPQVLTNTGAQ